MDVDFYKGIKILYNGYFPIKFLLDLKVSETYIEKLKNNMNKFLTTFKYYTIKEIELDFSNIVGNDWVKLCETYPVWFPLKSFNITKSNIYIYIYMKIKYDLR